MDPNFWPPFVVVVLSGLLLAVMPQLTRPDVFFAVTVQPALRRSEAGRRALRWYRFTSVGSTLAALAGIWLAGRHGAAVPFALLAVALQLFGAIGGFLLARRLVLPHAVAPSATREAVLVGRRTQLPGGWPVQVIPFALIAAAGFVVAARWSALPAEIPTHWGLSGEPDRWVPRSAATVFVPLATSAALCGVFLTLALSILRSRRVRATGAAASRENRFRNLGVLALFVGEMLIALSASRLAVLVLVPPEAAALTLATVITAGTAATILIALFMLRLGQGGSLGETRGADEAPAGDRTPDSVWKWGMFYVNRDDPALIVEKRFGIGYTFNFGHPMAWALLGVLLGAILIVSVVLR